ncbi:hypothetical protein [Methanococcus maripaludis]|uniref:Uncharacterized protein n=1 Tax=Methanococcus maripaludis TaxID=39152 RepID=A0A7J9NU14_METMI|nr:hypothetical protein [Methanococcus maripaludis]MBA2851180.1 hypothetical protein [Methanococcus maripaludis]MBA2858681.1 hypothetical protein [Methanococcus maripaludis]MBM7408435.1 hypothetical protein [Methanococcus maripaludis]MBP2220257.1 hypothetical protein [Methanococcus maripaludis]
MAEIIGKVKRKKGSFVYVDGKGNVIQKSRSEMKKKAGKKSKR